MFLLIFITCIGLLVSYLLLPFGFINRFLEKARLKIDKWLKWNWTIRTLMEGLMEIAFCTIITMIHVSKGSFASNFNLAFAYGLGVASVLFPAFLLIFYCTKFERMRDSKDIEFDEKYGAPYEGLKKDQR